MGASERRSELEEPKSSLETLDPTKAFTRLNRPYDSGRLQQAVGQEQSQQIINTPGAAFLQQAKILARQKALRTVGRVAKYGGGAAAAYEGMKATEDLCGLSQ
jgi:hypothetical protein